MFFKLSICSKILKYKSSKNIARWTLNNFGQPLESYFLKPWTLGGLQQKDSISAINLLW